jgi:hypothetical protein
MMPADHTAGRCSRGMPVEALPDVGSAEEADSLVQRLLAAVRTAARSAEAWPSKERKTISRAGVRNGIVPLPPSRLCYATALWVGAGWSSSSSSSHVPTR